MAEIVYWNPDEFEAANTKDVKVADKWFKIRALTPEQIIDFQGSLRAHEKLADDDPEKLKATYGHMKKVVKAAVEMPKLTEAQIDKLGRLLVPLFNAVMRFSGMDAATQAEDEDFR